MLRSVLASCFLFCLGANLFAQATLPVFQAAPPRFAGVYRVADGEFLSSAQDHRRGPEVIFNNMILSNYYSVPGSNQLWLDDGGLPDRNRSLADQVNGFDFTYCSTEPDQTGASGAIEISFYVENLACSGPPLGVESSFCSYELTGLPLGTQTGGIQCWIVSVDLSGGFECSTALVGFPTEEAGMHDRLFGWGFTPRQNNTGPWLAHGGYRRDNSFTWFDRSVSPPVFVGCFWFGGQPFANFATRWYGYERDVHLYYDSYDPVNRLIMNSTEPQAGGQVTYTVENPQAGRNYWLAASLDADPNEDTWFNGMRPLVDFGSPPGSGLLPPTPLLMPGGSLTVNLPVNIPDLVFLQALESIGPLQPANVTGMSNGVLIAETPPAAKNCWYKITEISSSGCVGSCPVAIAQLINSKSQGDCLCESGNCDDDITRTRKCSGGGTCTYTAVLSGCFAAPDSD
ncbi:MAG: hypothetical protein EYC70_14725 [Planctomycetota bacterium]|nr:MAG: hypothetical protein EYC70_14725 [Planctomycetota bacterium]